MGPDETSACPSGLEPATPISALGVEYLDRSPDLHCIIATADWRLLWVAGAWEQTFDWPVDSLLQVPLRDLVHPAEADPLFAALARADGGAHEFLARFRAADGSFHWLAWNGRTSRDGLRITAGARDVSDRIQTEAARSRQLSEARHAATHDPLTGLANRELLVEHLARTISRSLRTGAPPLLLFVDLDGFKRVNDQLGHQHGDEALRALSARLESAFRPSDLIARVGGDEFVVVLESGDPVTAAERIERAFAQPLQLAGRAYHVGATVGAKLVDDPNTTPGDAIAAADAEMYRAKQRRASGGSPHSRDLRVAPLVDISAHHGPDAPDPGPPPARD